eukprot:m.221411 g.221411  ORF g.221411 m.221411 type:complete len:349 (-) comp18719_c0_seq13:2951-3997(-)
MALPQISVLLSTRCCTGASSLLSSGVTTLSRFPCCKPSTPIAPACKAPHRCASCTLTLTLIRTTTLGATRAATRHRLPAFWKTSCAPGSSPWACARPPNTSASSASASRQSIWKPGIGLQTQTNWQSFSTAPCRTTPTFISPLISTSSIQPTHRASPITSPVASPHARPSMPCTASTAPWLPQMLSSTTHRAMPTARRPWSAPRSSRSSWHSWQTHTPQPRKTHREAANGASSSLAMVRVCTSSGPSARRRTRAHANMCASTKSCERPAAPCACMALSITSWTTRGATTLIMAISLRASLLPTRSIKSAAWCVSSRLWSMAIRQLAMSDMMVPCAASGLPKAWRSVTR